MTKGASRDASVDLSSDFVFLSSPTTPSSSPKKAFRLDADTGQVDFFDFPHASTSAMHGRPQSIIPTDIDAKILSNRDATLHDVQDARTKILRELQERIEELTARTKNLTETDNEENKTDSRKEQQLDHAKKAIVQRRSAAAKEACLAGCSTLWGGPYQTRSNDSLFSFSERFFGGGTTAHGINRVFDEDIGPLRRIFWMAIWIGGIYLAITFSKSVIFGYLEKGVLIAKAEGLHNGILPMVSVCNVSPFQCSCEAFYEPELLVDAYFSTVLPYLCNDVVVYKDTSPDPLSPITGSPLKRGALENSFEFVDMAKTKVKIEEFRPSLLNCDKEAAGVNKQWMVWQIKNGKATLTDLLLYAGLASPFPDKLKQTVKDCTVIDNKAGSITRGKKISCMDDSWWGAAYIHDRYGVCNVFNPCQDIPVGSDCETDQDCEHPLNTDSIEVDDVQLPEHARVEGGICDMSSRKCVCNACVQGKDCNVALQGKTGKGQGARLVLNSAPTVDASIMSSKMAQWSPGNWLHFHTAYDRGLLHRGISVAPGQVYDISLTREKFVDFSGYPFTNCSSKANIHVELCRENCLSRQATIECCGVNPDEVPEVTKGKFKQRMNYTLPNGVQMSPQRMTVENPFITYPSCSILDPLIAKCKADLEERFRNGEICLDGALGSSKPYSFLFIPDVWDKPNSYFDGGEEDDGVSDLEKQMATIKRNCVWGKDQLQNGLEAMLGKPCKANSDCRTSVGGDDGKCLEASRAFCPSRCNRYQYRVKHAASMALSLATASVLAARELATVTGQVKIKKETANDIRARKFKPKCEYETTNITDDMTEKEQQAVFDGYTACFNVRDSEEFVKNNYLVVNIDFTDFIETEYSSEEGVGLNMVIGVFGGNVGLFSGFSIMTFIEWCEMLFFLIMGIPVFVTGGKLNLFACCVRHEHDASHEDDGGNVEITTSKDL